MFLIACAQLTANAAVIDSDKNISRNSQVDLSIIDAVDARQINPPLNLKQTCSSVESVCIINKSLSKTTVYIAESSRAQWNKNSKIQFEQSQSEALFDSPNGDINEEIPQPADNYVFSNNNLSSASNQAGSDKQQALNRNGNYFALDDVIFAEFLQEILQASEFGQRAHIVWQNTSELREALESKPDWRRENYYVEEGCVEKDCGKKKSTTYTSDPGIIQRILSRVYGFFQSLNSFLVIFLVLSIAAALTVIEKIASGRRPTQQ